MVTCSRVGTRHILRRLESGKGSRVIQLRNIHFGLCPYGGNGAPLRRWEVVPLLAATPGVSEDVAFAILLTAPAADASLVYFAGEACVASSLLRASIRGAFVSGVVTAHNIMRSLDV